MDYVAKSVEDNDTFDENFEKFKSDNDFIFDANYKPYSQQDLNKDKGQKVVSFADAVQQHYENTNNKQ